MNIKLYVTNKYLNHFKRVLSMRRFTLDHSATFDMFMATLNKHVSCTEQYQHYSVNVVQYLDDENDWVDITNQCEWTETQRQATNQQITRVKLVLQTADKLVSKHEEKTDNDLTLRRAQMGKVLRELKQVHHANRNAQHGKKTKNYFLSKLHSEIKNHPLAYRGEQIRKADTWRNVLQEIKTTANHKRKQMSKHSDTWVTPKRVNQSKWINVHKELKNTFPRMRKTNNVKVPITPVVEQFKDQLDLLVSMGFENEHLNLKLLNHYKGDVTVVINSLLKL